jgi:hypothetical protein
MRYLFIRVFLGGLLDSENSVDGHRIWCTNRPPAAGIQYGVIHVRRARRCFCAWEARHRRVGSEASAMGPPLLRRRLIRRPACYGWKSMPSPLKVLDGSILRPKGHGAVRHPVLLGCSLKAPLIPPIPASLGGNWPICPCPGFTPWRARQPLTNNLFQHFNQEQRP